MGRQVIERDGSDPLGISLVNLGTVTAGTLQAPDRSLVLDLEKGVFTMTDNRSRWRRWFEDWVDRITRWFWPPIEIANDDEDTGCDHRWRDWACDDEDDDR